jgi:chromosome partitioning protein
LVPVQPCAIDLEAILGAEAIVRAAGKEPAFVLNRAIYRTRLAGAAVAWLRESGRRLMPVMHQRVEVAEAMERGLCALETAPGGAAARELAALWQAVQSAGRGGATPTASAIPSRKLPTLRSVICRDAA